MFHRRLLLLALFVCSASMVLAAQLGRLTVVEGDEHLEAARDKLNRQHFIPTIRGSILDSKGRMLATDQPCYDLLVDYELITNQWAYNKARRKVWRKNRNDWGKLTETQREQLIAPTLAEYSQYQTAFWLAVAKSSQISDEKVELKKQSINERIQKIRRSVWQREIENRKKQQGDDFRLQEVPLPTIREQTEKHAFLKSLTDTQALALRQQLDELPLLEKAFDLREAKTRIYPHEMITVEIDRSTLPSAIRQESSVELTVNGVATHMVGTLRDTWAEDVKANPFLLGGGKIDLWGYRSGEKIGRSGLEKSQEQRLRGTRGKKVIHLYPYRIERIEPIPGEDVHLTLDVQLQARIAALMDPSFGLMRVQEWHGHKSLSIGTPLYGSAIVMETRTGAIRAMVSTPTYSREQLRRFGGKLATDMRQPMVNRPVEAIYPPASTMKPIVYAMSVQAGVLKPGEIIDCKGHLFPDRPDIFRDWGWRPKQGMYLAFGPIGPSDAIKRSSNYYFYDCGQRMGPQAMLIGYKRWGVGEALKFGLPESIAGILPRMGERNPVGREPSQTNAIFLGIGQGPIAIPPIQVANAHAALARGGVWREPLLVEDDADKQSFIDLNMPSSVHRDVLDGMWKVVNDPKGTGHHLPGKEPIFNIDGVVVRGKTGTAQAPIQFEDMNGNNRYDAGDRVFRRGNHGWFIAYTGPPGDETRFVICVMVEYGHSGGRSAGPVANQILHALKAEGYF